MGGSGGGGFFSSGTKPKDLQEKIRAEEARARDNEFEAAVAIEINSLLAAVNQRNVEAIQRHLEEITAALEKEIEGSIKMLFGGSVAKHTYIDGLSDIDALVIINKTELREADAGEVMKYFSDRLRERYPETEVTEGKLAVTIKFSDVEVQLLPALKIGEGIKIPKGDGTNWSSVIRPDRFASKLADVNQKCGGRVVPIIKLTKSIMAQLPERLQIIPYHVESLAVQVFRVYQGDQTSKAILKHFFQSMPELIKEPIKDSTKQSLHVDDYLGEPGSLKRRLIADAVGRIAREMQNADGARSKDQWKKILGK